MVQYFNDEMSNFDKSSRIRKREHCRGRAKRCDVVVVDHLEHVDGLEFLKVVDKHVCAGNPLPVEFAPYGLAPSGVGECQVEAVFMKVVPIGAGDDVSGV